MQPLLRLSVRIGRKIKIDPESAHGETWDQLTSMYGVLCIKMSSYYTSHSSSNRVV